MFPAIIAAVAFIGGVTSNLVANYIQSRLEPYRRWVWAIFFFALIVTIIAAIREALSSSDSTQKSLQPAEESISEENQEKTTEKRRLRVFLCYASEDKNMVSDLYMRLELDRTEPWFDEKKLLPGQVWREEISRAVRNSDVVVVCLSKSAVTKEGYVQKEIKLALDIAEKKPKDTIFIVPVKLEECTIPKRLSHLHWVDLQENSSYGRRLSEAGLSRLAGSLGACATAVGAQSLDHKVMPRIVEHDFSLPSL